jgi:rhodanese-related sulfurtransferase
MIAQVRPSQLATWIASNPSADPALGAVVLDVREPWEWQQASVKPDGFTLLHIAMGELPARLAEIPVGAPIACLCHHGTRSQRVAAYLEQRGHGPLANIAGGIDAWAGELDSTVPRY